MVGREGGRAGTPLDVHHPRRGLGPIVAAVEHAAAGPFHLDDLLQNPAARDVAQPHGDDRSDHPEPAPPPAPRQRSKGDDAEDDEEPDMLMGAG